MAPSKAAQFRRLEELLHQGLSLREASRRAGVSRSTASRWIRNGGLGADLEHAAVALANERPLATLRRLAERLSETTGTRVSVAWVHGVLKRNGIAKDLAEVRPIKPALRRLLRQASAWEGRLLRIRDPAGRPPFKRGERHSLKEVREKLRWLKLERATQAEKAARADEWARLGSH